MLSSQPRPMLATERELLLAITATCFAINEQTEHAAYCSYSSASFMVDVKATKEVNSEVLFSNWRQEYDTYILFNSSLWPDNTTILTKIMGELTNFLPVHTALNVANKLLTIA